VTSTATGRDLVEFTRRRHVEGDGFEYLLTATVDFDKGQGLLFAQGTHPTFDRYGALSGLQGIGSLDAGCDIDAGC
jgi:hypothetical protein